MICGIGSSSSIERGLVWSRVRLEDVGRFVAWLRLPAAARAGNVQRCRRRRVCCSEATVNRKLSAISAFYEFHQRHGVDLGDLLTTWQRRGTRGGSWRPLLAHLGSRPERSRRIRLRAERRIPDTLDAEQIAAIVAACDRLRDRFLFTLLSECGLRIGEALGLRHSDIDAAARLVSVVPRRNSNRARAKGGGGRQVPVPARVIRLYADYLHAEYGDLDSDYVFVNLWSGPIGSPLTYPSVYDLVCRIAGADRNHVRAAYFSTHVCDRAVAPQGAGRGGAASVGARVDRHDQRRVRASEGRGRAPGVGGRGVADRPGRVAVSVEALATPIESDAGPSVWMRWCVRSSGLDVLVPAVGDPILGTPACAVPGCVHSSRYAALCLAHLGRWKQAGRPDRQAWAATADPDGDGPPSRCNRAWCPIAGSGSIGIGCATSIPTPGTEPDDQL